MALYEVVFTNALYLFYPINELDLPRKLNKEKDSS